MRMGRSKYRAQILKVGLALPEIGGSRILVEEVSRGVS